MTERDVNRDLNQSSAADECLLDYLVGLLQLFALATTINMQTCTGDFAVKLVLTLREI